MLLVKPIINVEINASMPFFIIMLIYIYNFLIKSKLISKNKSRKINK